jgi:hypothetical protein
MMPMPTVDFKTLIRIFLSNVANRYYLLVMLYLHGRLLS